MPERNEEIGACPNTFPAKEGEKEVISEHKHKHCENEEVEVEEEL